MDATAPTPELLLVTVPEAGKLLRLSPRTVYNLHRQGKLKIRKIGKSARVSVSDMRAYVDSLQQQGGAA